MTPLRALIWAAVSTKAQAAEDKDSIPRQIADAQAMCAANGWQIVDTLIVDGHSRYYKDFAKAAADMRAAGIDALDKLAMYCEMKAFDVFVVRDGSRFARRQSLHARVTEMIIDAGARIYAAMYGGFVDSKNFSMFIAMDGYRVTGENAVRKELSVMGRRKNVSRGIPIGRGAYPFRKVRDVNTGKTIRLEIDPSKMPMMFVLGQAVLDGVPYAKMGDLLASQGIFQPSGKPYTTSHCWQRLVDPWIWGHAIFGLDKIQLMSANKTLRIVKLVGPWCLDLVYPIPPEALPHVEIFYNTHTPIFCDEQGNLSLFGQRVKAEIIRRMVTGKNVNRQGRRQEKFSMLLVCAVCGYPMPLAIKTDKKRYRGYRCTSSLIRKGKTPCDRAMQIAETKVIRWVDALLRQIITSDDLTTLRPQREEETDLKRIYAQIDDAERQIAILVVQQSNVSSLAAQRAYGEQIEALGKQIDMLHKQRARQEQQRAAFGYQSQELAFQFLRETTIDAFWQLESGKINQWLHLLFGKTRIVVEPTKWGGRIIGLRVG